MRLINLISATVLAVFVTAALAMVEEASSVVAVERAAITANGGSPALSAENSSAITTTGYTNFTGDADFYNPVQVPPPGFTIINTPGLAATFAQDDHSVLLQIQDNFPVNVGAWRPGSGVNVTRLITNALQGLCPENRDKCLNEVRTWTTKYLDKNPNDISQPPDPYYHSVENIRNGAKLTIRIGAGGSYYKTKQIRNLLINALAQTLNSSLVWWNCKHSPGAQLCNFPRELRIVAPGGNRMSLSIRSDAPTFGDNKCYSIIAPAGWKIDRDRVKWFSTFPGLRSFGGECT
ncbi:hypothetical protein K504DRAFT_489428 [Pleomassaria siparia CBS 279.74]|uniref:Uncharacterized protein n=1 Tax=Pleomassaria siparia CBS 279.74 TaxID=1314801 RepID=A0A6G1KF97_9PLEO|nr:hypothetical protein K504DRAFT_489428 [Pleomassaria siparia CBS 279.74]